MLLLFFVVGVRAWAAPVVEELQIPFPDEFQRSASRTRRVNLEHVKVAYSVPENFDPAKAWPILVVSATSDPAFNSSTTHLKRYAEPAANAGWVVIAADPPVAAPPGIDTNELRFALVGAALEEFERRWPGSGKWPIAFGGFSGGSKRSGWLAAMLAAKGRVPIGIFQGGCNAPTAAEAIKLYNPPRRTFRAIPVFLSSGRDDKISTVRDHEQVETALRADGFKNVRREIHEGEHRLHPPHVQAALRWFAERSAGL
jgi:hypothetical protein